jgi:hypothetical protein
VSLLDWPRPEELKPAEGRRVRIVIRHRCFPEWADNGTWEGTLVKAHADWWTCQLRLDDGADKFLDLRPATEWSVVPPDGADTVLWCLAHRRKMRWLPAPAWWIHDDGLPSGGNPTDSRGCMSMWSAPAPINASRRIP